MRPKTVRFVRAVARPGDFPQDGFPEVVVAGRSNVGKSSLINRLLGRAGIARTSKTPGRTQEIHFYLVDERCYLVDLPGFGYAKVPAKLRAAWEQLIASYFAERGTLRLALQLVDARHEPQPVDLQLTAAFVEREVPFVVALTKGDKITRSQGQQAVARTRKLLQLADGVPVILTSAETGAGVADLAALVAQAWQSQA